MTTKEERYKEFMERCVSGEEKTVRISGSADRKREAERFRNLSDYHEKAARDNLEGRAPLMAIREGYYVMLHKANEALALASFKSKTHECALLGLRGVFDAPELADDLRRAFRERQNVEYYMNPEKPELEEFKNAGDFVKNVMKPFVERTDELIDKKGFT